MKKYDFLIVGSGLFGATLANLLRKQNKTVLVIEKRNHIGGNIYTEYVDDIHVHKYGAHIFHTSNEEVWKYVTSLVEFNDFINSPIANFHGEFYHLPFNMNTFCELWKDVKTSEDAQKKIEEEKSQYHFDNPKNLEEQAISLVGPTIYSKLIKGYTEKQWGRKCTELPAFIIKRIPVRFTFDNNYFNDKYQGIPINGYTDLIEKMLDGVEVKLNSDYFTNRKYYDSLADKIIYTGPIDKFFDYKFGNLEYRSVSFKNERLNQKDYQGNAVVNYTDRETPFTRIIEHKHFDKNNKSPVTIISKEYPKEWNLNEEPYYPINNEKNTAILAKYEIEKAKYPNVYFGGRLANYKYFDMDDTIEEAFKLFNSISK